MDLKLDMPDANVAAVASRQHGVATRRQLEAVGLGPKTIARRVHKRQLHRLHRGVYAGLMNARLRDTEGRPTRSDLVADVAAVLAA